jgi:hypothetical protein
MSRSRERLCPRPLRVTDTSVVAPASPLMVMPEGYGLAVAPAGVVGACTAGMVIAVVFDAV